MPALYIQTAYLSLLPVQLVTQLRRPQSTKARSLSTRFPRISIDPRQQHRDFRLDRSCARSTACAAQVRIRITRKSFFNCWSVKLALALSKRLGASKTAMPILITTNERLAGCVATNPTSRK